MDARLLVLRAGTGASTNLIHSLRAGAPSLVVVGANHDRFVLKKSLAERNSLLPEPRHPRFFDALCEIIVRERIDLLIPDSDPDVKLVSDRRDRLPCRVFLPAGPVIDLCQDKYALTCFLEARGLAVARTYPVTDVDTIPDLFRRLPSQPRLWCRIRRGAGSMGALPVKTPEQAQSWISYWHEMRGVPPTEFTLSEYLPGRDYSVQGLWKDGRLVLMKMSERLSYFGGNNQPSGTSSTPALAKTVLEPAALQLCTDVVSAIDPHASGVFCFDVKENARGVPCLTEVNAGRFAMITPIYDLTGKHNMAVTYVRLALDDDVDVGEVWDVAEDHYLVRDLDTTPAVFDAEALFHGIDEPGRAPGLLPLP